MAEVQTEARVFINGFDLSAYLTTITDTADRNMLDTTNFASTGGAREFQPGISERTISAEGFFAYNSVDDVFSVDKLFSDALDASSERLISYGTQGAITAGDIATMANIKQASYNVGATYGELIMSSFEAKATAAVGLKGYARGVWLISQVFTGAANGASYDNAASSTGYFAHVHNTNADGTATVKIQHSSDNSVWVDLIDFGAVAAVAAEQAYNTATSVNRYVRVIVTAIGGTTAKISAAIKLGYTG